MPAWQFLLHFLVSVLAHPHYVLCLLLELGWHAHPGVDAVTVYTPSCLDGWDALSSGNSAKPSFDPVQVPIK